MRKTIIMFITIVVLVLLVSYHENHYTRYNCEVVEVQDNYIKAYDNATDTTWEFYADGLKIGNRVDLQMYTNNTTHIYDDEVKDISIRWVRASAPPTT